MGQQEREQWQAVNAENERRFTALGERKITVGGLGERWIPRMLEHLLGDDYDQVRLEHEQWVADELDKVEEQAPGLLARAVLLDRQNGRGKS